MKEEYFRLVNEDDKEIMYPTLTINRSVVQAGKLEEKMGELKQEVVEANKSVNRLHKELQMTMGGWQGQQVNPWQVGVPSGSKSGRAVGGERDRFGRQVGERGPGNRCCLFFFINCE